MPGCPTSRMKYNRGHFDNVGYTTLHVPAGKLRSRTTNTKQNAFILPYGPLVPDTKNLLVAHALGMPGTFSPPSLTSEEIAI